MSKTRFLAGSMLGTVLMVGMPAAAFAQDAAAPTTTTPPAAQADQTDQGDQSGAIVVTGTLFRRTNTETPSPVTVLSSETLQQRGVNTVTQALQSLASNNAGTIPNAWNAGGSNFASGASSISLRGLNSSYTLVLFDGMRSAFYPYADDGSRNFVDTNTIPEGIVDRIEVLRDGASSTYGADAVAGVVNIITKKQITGLHLNASAGISQRGDDGERRIDGTWGFGDLATQGFNFYVAAEYQHNDPLYAADRYYPFNTADQSHVCGPSNGQGTVAAGQTVCRTNGIANGIQYDGTYAGQQATIVPIVRPYLAPGAGANALLGATTPVAGSRYQLLNPALGCQGLPSIGLTGPQLTNTGGNAGAAAAFTQCQQDLTKDYLAIEPELQRIGGSARLTVALGDNAQLYAEGNFYQATEHTTAANYATNSGGFRTAAGGVQLAINTITLPVYVCPRGTTAACTAANGTLNPNNPFAAQGNVARILWRLPYQEGVDVRSRTYRGALGVNGSFGDGSWQYSVDGTYSHIDNLLTYHNVVWVQHFLDVVADGSFNFVNPAANSQAILNYIMPTDSTPSSSEVDQVQASLSHSFFDLPGGPLQVGVGGSIRYEADNWNSSNPPDPSNPANRYVALINAVGATGHRWVESGYFEINAPIVKQFEINASGRYDHYSSGQSAFSPKIGAKFTPIPQIAFRGTFSKGFRIPSFNEAFGLPTTGYVGGQVTNTTPGSAAYFAAHGNDAYATGPYTYGLTTSGNPNLQPEKSRNITAGVIIQPVHWLSLTADYYNIRIKNLITPAEFERRDRGLLRQQRRGEHSGRHGDPRRGRCELPGGTAADRLHRVELPECELFADLGARFLGRGAHPAVRRDSPDQRRRRHAPAPPRTVDRRGDPALRRHAQPVQHHVVLGRAAVAWKLAEHARLQRRRLALGDRLLHERL